MPPLHSFDTWDRVTETGSPVEPRKRLYLLCEGSVSEEDYFDELIDLLNRKKLPKYMAVGRTVRTGKDESSSHPKKLLEFARQIIDGSLDNGFMPGDEVALVFDADIYKGSQDELDALLDQCEDADVQAYVTYPSFELFLFLHLEDGLDKWVFPHKEEIVQNKKTEGKRRRYIAYLFSDASGVNTKTRGACRRFAKDYLRACREEKRINQDATQAVGQLTSDVGLLIEHLLES